MISLFKSIPVPVPPLGRTLCVPIIVKHHQQVQVNCLAYDSETQLAGPSKLSSICQWRIDLLFWPWKQSHKVAGLIPFTSQLQVIFRSRCFDTFCPLWYSSLAKIMNCLRLILPFSSDILLQLRWHFSGGLLIMAKCCVFTVAHVTVKTLNQTGRGGGLQRNTCYTLAAFLERCLSEKSNSLRKIK